MHTRSEITLLDVEPGPYWVKLGEGNLLANRGIDEGRIYVRWPEAKLEDIRSNRWDEIEKDIRAANTASKASATRQYRMFAMFCSSTHRDIWVTFHRSCMYWGRLKEDSPVEIEVINGVEWKYRELDSEGWSPKNKKGKILYSNQLPGIVAMMSGWQQTLSTVRSQEYEKRPEILMAVIDGEPTTERIDLEHAKMTLQKSLVPAIEQLHPNDFEILVDLIFRQAGWKRRTVLGSIMRDVDLELEEPMLKYMASAEKCRYAIQVKSKATLEEFRAFCALCKNNSEVDGQFGKGYFFVHSDYNKIAEWSQENQDQKVELVVPFKIADMIIEFGLVGWILDRTV